MGSGHTNCCDQTRRNSLEEAAHPLCHRAMLPTHLYCLDMWLPLPNIVCRMYDAKQCNNLQLSYATYLSSINIMLSDENCPGQLYPTECSQDKNFVP